MCIQYIRERVYARRIRPSMDMQVASHVRDLFSACAHAKEKKGFSLSLRGAQAEREDAHVSPCKPVPSLCMCVFVCVGLRLYYAAWRERDKTENFKFFVRSRLLVLLLLLPMKLILYRKNDMPFVRSSFCIPLILSQSFFFSSSSFHHV